MTIDERAAACEQELMNAYHSIGGEEFSDVLLRHLRAAVAERDALLDKCRNLSSLGIAAMGYTYRGDEKNAKEQTAMIEAIQAEITAMIGEQA